MKHRARLPHLALWAAAKTCFVVAICLCLLALESAFFAVDFSAARTSAGPAGFLESIYFLIAGLLTAAVGYFLQQKFNTVKYFNFE